MLTVLALLIVTALIAVTIMSPAFRRSRVVERVKLNAVWLAFIGAMGAALWGAAYLFKGLMGILNR